MVRTVIQLPEDEAEALARTAKRRGMSKAEVIRQALEAVFVADRDELVIERALRAAGAGRSGVPDLGERHDEYLAELHRPA